MLSRRQEVEGLVMGRTLCIAAGLLLAVGLVQGQTRSGDSALRFHHLHPLHQARRSATLRMHFRERERSFKDSAWVFASVASTSFSSVRPQTRESKGAEVQPIRIWKPPDG